MDKKKKVGIMTFHASHNCGSMLQAYALQYVLREKYNLDAEIINFSNHAQRGMYGYIDLRLKRGAIENSINRLQHIPTIRKTRKDYIEFFNKYLVVSKTKYTNNKQLKNAEEAYDVLISGGDQVWNIRCGDADLAYFLCFAKNTKKVSYSPSFGATNISKYAKDVNVYKNLLNEYDAISVREGNGQKWLKELLNKEVPVIVDPTMLLTAKEWCKALETTEVKGKYIFYYAFSYANKENVEQIRKISERTGMPVYMIDALQYRVYHLDKQGFKLYKTGPLGFISLMKNAEMIFSQSFHGTIFSALFEKKFWAFHNSTIANPDDDRATYILQQLGLSDRYINIEKIDEIDINKEIDYEKVNKKIDSLKEEAFKYIEDNIVK